MEWGILWFSVKKQTYIYKIWTASDVIAKMLSVFKNMAVESQ